MTNMTMLLAVATGLRATNFVLLIVLLRRSTSDSAESAVREELRKGREESAQFGRDLRADMAFGLKSIQESSESRTDSLRRRVEERLDSARQQALASSRELRDEVRASLKGATDSIVKQVEALGGLQRTTLDGIGRELKGLGETTRTGLDVLKGVVDAQLKEIREANSRKLDEIRRTVDEQLQGTLEKRLTESFKLVSDHLESVQQGLGEMKALATGVGDLKRVLTNVKARGTWAEMQLGAILEEILSPEQYGKNVQIRCGSGERVEYAVRLPGRNNDSRTCVLLPIDSKFPQESYVRLMDASERADGDGVQAAVSELSRTIRQQAQEIRDKYVAPPATTDFGVLFLPTEGLYAEVLRIPGLAAELQQQLPVIVAGPTNLAALLSSLRVGFQTIAIERRASEVWIVLRAVKTEFGKYGAVLTKLRNHLDLATRTIDATDVRTRAMERRLREVEELPPDMAAGLLRLPPDASSGHADAGLGEN